MVGIWPIFRCELFVSGFTTIDGFSLPRNALQVDCLWKRNFDEVEEVHLMHGVVLHRWWPGGRRGWLCVWARGEGRREWNQSLTPHHATWNYQQTPLKIGNPKRKLIFQPSIFQGRTVKFRGCNQPAEYHTRINSMEDVKNRSCTSAKVPLNLW